jgi:hypothetical protein
MFEGMDGGKFTRATLRTSLRSNGFCKRAPRHRSRCGTRARTPGMASKRAGILRSRPSGGQGLRTTLTHASSLLPNML